MLNHSHSHSRPASLSPLLRVLSSHAAECSPPPPPPSCYSEHGACRVTMDLPPSMSPSSSSGQQQPTTPRRQLQGPRPPRLNVRMESHAIKKPSSGAGPSQAHVHQLPAQAQARREQQGGQQPQPPPRAPVIIYDASPKIIHAKPNEFMALVQRLTGPGSGPPPPMQPHQGEAKVQDYPMEEAVPGQPFFPPELLLSPSAAMSPAARLATIERSVRPMPEPTPGFVDITIGGGVDDGGLAAILGSIRPGILSPLPSSLPPAAVPGQFSPLPFDATCISWLNELSPILRAASAGSASSGSGGSGGVGGNTSNGGASRPPPSYYADPFVPSPRHLLATPTVPSPATCAELFSNLPDL